MLEIGRALKESSTAVLEHRLRSLDLLSTPASVGITHVCWGLDRGNVLQNSVGKTNNANKGTRDNAVPAIANGYATDENVEDTTAEEGEHEGGIASDLLRDLELKQSSAGTENDEVNTKDDVRATQFISPCATSCCRSLSGIALICRLMPESHDHLNRAPCFCVASRKPLGVCLRL